MSTQALVHEISSEKDTNIQILKAKLSNLQHSKSSPVNIADDSQEIKTQISDVLDNDSVQPSVINDETIVRTNTVPYIFASLSNPNNFGDCVRHFRH